MFLFQAFFALLCPNHFHSLNMHPNAELNALFSLIDDPDEEIFHLITKRIITYGREVIPCLEDLCEITADDKILQRITEIIRQVHFDSLISEFQLWNAESTHDLLTGSHLVASYSYPNLSLDCLRQNVSRLKREVWLETNDYLTSLETATVVSNILFKFQKIQSERNNYQHLEHFCLHTLLEKKKGNALSTGILYQYLCEALEIPIQLINVPDQHILACFQRDILDPPAGVPFQTQILFYIDATTGKLFSQYDLDKYFEQYHIPKKDSYFQPLTHQKIIGNMATEVGKCYLSTRELDRKKDLDKIAALLSDGQN